MRPLVLSAAIALMTGSVAYGQEPASKPDTNAMQPPTNRLEQATPDRKAPEGQQQIAPTNRVGEAVPPMKSTDAQSADTGTKAGGFVPDASWAGRYVYSSDGKDLGKIVSVQKTGASSDILFDMGGFLGLGATRKHATPDQVQDVQKDRIVLRLSKAEAENLPAEK